MSKFRFVLLILGASSLLSSSVFADDGLTPDKFQEQVRTQSQASQANLYRQTTADLQNFLKQNSTGSGSGASPLGVSAPVPVGDSPAPIQAPAPAPAPSGVQGGFKPGQTQAPTTKSFGSSIYGSPN